MFGTSSQPQSLFIPGARPGPRGSPWSTSGRRRRLSPCGLLRTRTPRASSSSPRRACGPRGAPTSSVVPPPPGSGRRVRLAPVGPVARLAAAEERPARRAVLVPVHPPLPLEPRGVADHPRWVRRELLTVLPPGGTHRPEEEEPRLDHGVSSTDTGALFLDGATNGFRTCTTGSGAC